MREFYILRILLVILSNFIRNSKIYFYDLLYEKEEKTKQVDANPAEYFGPEKYYTMGPGIDFPLIMQYSAVEQKSSSAEEQNSRSTEVQQGSRLEAQSPFTFHLLRSKTNCFYFLNGHFGFPFVSLNKNSLLFNGFEFDVETNLYKISATFYNPSMGRVLKDLNYEKEAVPVAISFIIYPEKINKVIVSMMPMEDEPPEPMPPPIPNPFCGNGKTKERERCDDGNTNDNDCCDANCKNTGNCRPFKGSNINCKWEKRNSL